MKKLVIFFRFSFFSPRHPGTGVVRKKKMFFVRKMIFYPNAKINIGLNIISKRKDGYRGNEGRLISLPHRGPVEETVQDLSLIHI